MTRQRKHSQDILDKLDECRKNKQSFLEQTGIDMKALAEMGLMLIVECTTLTLMYSLTTTNKHAILAHVFN